MTDLYTNVNGIKICYEIHGEGYPIILIHGLGAKKETWVGQIGPLSKIYKTITLDIRGAGKSDRPNEPYTMETFAEDIKCLMDFLNIEQAHIIGRSLGGLVAQHVVLNYPERVKKVIFITTSSVGVPDEKAAEFLETGRIEQIEMLKKDPINAFWIKSKIIFHQSVRKQMKANPKKKFFDIWSAEDLIREDTIDPPTPQDIKNLVHAIKHHNTLNRLSEIKNKSLIIAGSHDRLYPKLVMATMHEKIPNSELKVIEKAGHYLTLSRAPEVNQIILEFLEN